MHTGLSVLTASVLLGFFSLWGTCARAEEILIKNNGIHLGWVISKNTFMTCHNKIIEIGQANVESTKHLCPFFQEIQLVKGLVENIDRQNQILWIRDEEGKVQELFFFEDAQSNVKTKLKDLEEEDKVTVTVPIPGRCGLIQIENRQNSKRSF